MYRPNAELEQHNNRQRVVLSYRIKEKIADIARRSSRQSLYIGTDSWGLRDSIEGKINWGTGRGDQEKATKRKQEENRYKYYLGVWRQAQLISCGVKT